MNTCALRVSGLDTFEIGQRSEMKLAGIVEAVQNGWEVVLEGNRRVILSADDPKGLRTSEIPDGVFAIGRNTDWHAFAVYCRQAEATILWMYCSGGRKRT